MVRKVSSLIVMIAVMLTAYCGAASAATYEVYEGTPSNTYVTYFRDLMGSVPVSDNYIMFRSGQYEYTMIVGEIYKNNDTFSSDTTCTVYTIQNPNSYNSYYNYSIETIDTFSVNVGDKLIYSDIGNYPQFEERSQKYEILNTILIVVALLSVVIGRFFGVRTRRYY